MWLMATGCEKETCNEPVPDLTFNRFEQTGFDTSGAVYSLYYDFKDCDGDIGLQAGESITDSEGNVYEYNFFIDMYYFESGEWKKQEYPSGPGLNSRIPPLYDDGASPVLDGEIEYRLSYVGSGLYLHDTVMFRTRLLDNAGHFSNEVESPAFVITE